MIDKAAPKPKRPAKDKPKVTGPKLVEKDLISGNIGHNSNNGEVNPEAVKLLDEIMDCQKRKKAIAVAERDARNRLKTEFGILSSSVSREVALRKLDKDVRVQVETNHEDFKKMVGYQPSLDFVGGHATHATQKAVAAQEKAAERNTEPVRTPTPSADPAERYNVTDDEDDGSQAPNNDVIEREG